LGDKFIRSETEDKQIKWLSQSQHSMDKPRGRNVTLSLLLTFLLPI
jgi:esterase/lipase